MKISPRRRARECAVQAIYSWYISQNTVEEVELAFVTDQNMKGVDMPYFRKLFRGVVDNVEAIDEALRPYLDRKESDVDPIERSILRLSTYELKFEHDVPFRVVINEGIEVAKVFGSDDSHKYINGILDKLAPALGRK
ncbi:transcription antitermination protein NusB [Mannheimia haemolytica USMARC_2286]|uniref:transcription antitermination factor NusB n=1 Tax=Mannheimia haemolytica TaxID=75985 RepID=UPI00035B9C3A|nr:transcription antitermination factor NusB [Mannheimia haemolytica]AGR75700.1 transcription antitermination protein NusB [Mannheimia haemolytica USMARC_2286]